MFKQISSFFAVVIVAISCMYVSAGNVEAAAPPHHGPQAIAMAIESQAESARIPQIVVFYPDEAEYAVSYIMEHHQLRTVNGQRLVKPEDVYHILPNNIFRIVFAN